MNKQGLGWLGIVRLGLVQTALGAIVILTTSTMNRVMVVELALPAILPGALVAFYYAIQMLRPRFGYGSDVGGRLTNWIIGGMAALAAGGILSACATALMATNVWQGILLAVFAFMMVGVGVGASGTSLLVLLTKKVEPYRRAAAATIVWLMMICGFIITATTAGHFLDPFSNDRLIAVTACVSVIAFVVTVLAVRNVENSVANTVGAEGSQNTTKPPFLEALKEVWQEQHARRFTIFVFVSMLAYSAQDLILEPFAGLVFDFTPGQSTKLAGIQNGGLLTGMILIALIGTWFNHRKIGALRIWMVGGCAASAAALAGLAIAGMTGPPWPLRLSVFALGFANGAFAVAAIGSMMELAGKGRQSREGVRMGLWGAAQAIAFGLGGFLGAAAVDIARYAIGDVAVAYALVFAAQALMFLIAAVLATRIGEEEQSTRNNLPATPYMAGNQSYSTGVEQ